ncbi:hypothetical protein [Paludisphaera rhizosphaerae]|uniref:hypothetical protein n=1 Tax=Paludisphaera rhizosphaerae TaxID=2711216 RepID=UPI0013EC9063|nr:hypothetical protein [Paludisphaera rhizosphaerae]
MRRFILLVVGAGLILAAPTIAGEGADGVIRVRIPSKMVAGQFPPDTPLRVLAPEAFDALVDQVDARDRQRAQGGPRLIRARHSARFADGLLTGRSELALSIPPGRSTIPLEPWTPAILNGRGERVSVVAAPSGRAFLRIEPDAGNEGDGQKVVTLEWELRARPDSRGRIFALALPGDETTSLTLDVPKGWEPSGAAARRDGPTSGEGVDREVWRFSGRIGVSDLRLTNRGETRDPREAPRIWVGGATRIDLDANARSAGKPANWTMDWTLQADEPRAGSFTVQLDPGLELLGVEGPSVREFHVQEGAPDRVVVTLSGATAAPTPVRFLAHTRVPAEGVWSAPAIRPLPPLTWTGGTTTIVLDERHVVRDCRERDGRRIPTPPGEPALSATVLAFEAVGPGSVADLTFRPSMLETVAAVRGRLLLRESTARIECEVSGLGVAGTASEHELEIPAGWAVDRIEISGIEEPTPWNQSSRGDGSSLLRVLVPASEVSPMGRTLLIGAAFTKPSVFPGTFRLPRIRPARGRLQDEAWVALATSRIQMEPGDVQGLAWIDPSQTPGLMVAATSATASATADLAPVLAWRWTSTDAAAVEVQTRLATPIPAGWIHVRARIEEDGRRLALLGRATITSPDAGTTVPIRLWIEGKAADLSSWTFYDAATGRRAAPTILAEEDRRRLEFPDEGQALELSVEPGAGGRAAVDFRAAFPWEGRGRVPLPALPPSHAPVGVIVVETPRAVRSLVEGQGLSRVEASLADRLAPGPDPTIERSGRSTSQAVQALTYAETHPRLELTTERLTPAAVTGLIRDALLTTQAFPDGRSLNRLRLLAAVDQTEALTFQLPPGAVLAAARVDGRPATPGVEDGRTVIPLFQASNERTRSIELDYRVEPAGSAERRRVQPAVPDFGVPCLSFAWDLSLPAGQVVDEAGPGFVVDAAEPRVAWPFGSLGIPRRRWPGERPVWRAPREDALRRLDDLLGDPPIDELTFAEVFMRWDSAGAPIVIDRAALAAEGLGPRSRCLPPPRQPGSNQRPMQTLQQHDLTMALVDDALLVTSRRASAASSDFSDWRPSLAEAVMWGADATDRFQSVGRWRGEPSTSEAPSSRLGRAPGWSTWRLSATSWPDPEAAVATADAASLATLGWALALVIFVIGMRRVVSARRGLIAPLTLMIAMVVVHDGLTRVPAAITAGPFVGAFAVLLVRLGRLLRETLFRPIRPPGTPSGRQRTFLGRRGMRLAAWTLAAAWLSQAAAQQAGGPVEPIRALIPYDGEFDPAASPSRVVLREADYKSLLDRARPLPSAAATEQGPSILSAEHRVTRGEGRELVIISEYEVQAEPGFTRFEFPVGDAHDLEAFLDDRRAPVIVAAGGESATVLVPADKTSRLRLRRLTSPLRDGGVEAIDLRINAAPAARLSLEQPLGARQRIVARGRVVAGEDQTIKAVLGPVDRISVGWNAGDQDVDQAAATVESLMLWDLDPAGERVRARLTYRPRRRISTIRVALEPGLVPRSVQIPGLVDSSWGGTPQNPEWIARIDPPITERTTVALDFWRPLRGGDPGGAATRRFPRVEPLGVDRESGLLAVRRPGHWTGRLEPALDSEPVGDETFVRAWGTLPDDPLTFAGTLRLSAKDVVEFRTGPSPTRYRRRVATRLQVDSGRVDCQFDVELSEISGLLDKVDLELPRELIVLDVESAGMTDWSRRDEGPLQLRFDRIDLKSRRTIQVRGWIPVPQLAAASGLRRHRLRLPWVDAFEGRGAGGSLEVLSRGGVDLATDSGVSLLTSGQAETGAVPNGPWTRQTYRVDDPGHAGELRWAPQPPRVNVTIGSQLTVHPDSAEWVAVLRYEVAGGPLEAIHLKLPTMWNASAQIQLAGQEFQPTTESRDSSTYWTIIPGRPIWGAQRLVLRSRTAITPGREVVFPEIVPLGRGFVDSSLALVFATATLPATSGSAGLREISYASRFQDDEFGASVDLPARAYHVERREGWMLAVQPPAEEAGAGSLDAAARARSAEVSYVLGGGGPALGTASFQVEPRSGRFLTVAPPEGGRLLRASVDGAAVVPLLDAESRWTIPMGADAAGIVGLTWMMDRRALDGTASTSLAVPRVGDGRTPALVAVYAPPGRTVRPSAAGLEAVGSERLQLDRADRIGRRIFDLIAVMDRGSGADRERLSSLLIDHESALREAEHALLAALRSPDLARRERAARDLEVVNASRVQMAEALRPTGLDEPIAAARDYLGLERPEEASPGPSVPEQTDRERIRRLGRPTFFAGPSPGLADPPFRLEAVDDPSGEPAVLTESRARSLLLLALLLGLGLAGLTSARRIGAQSLIAAASLSLAAVAGGPLALIGCGLALAAGWATKGPGPRESVAGA